MFHGLDRKITLAQFFKGKHGVDNVKITRNLSECLRDARKLIAVPVHAKLIYKYQILYLDRITIVTWRHLI